VFHRGISVVEDKDGEQALAVLFSTELQAAEKRMRVFDRRAATSRLAE
jgi:hypothetical protein